MTFVALAAMALPLAAFGSQQTAKGNNGKPSSTTFITPTLLAAAQQNPKSTYNVIVQGVGSGKDSDKIAKKVAQYALDADGSTAQIKSQFTAITGVSVNLTGKAITKLLDKNDGAILSITPNAPVKVSGLTFNTQLWPYESGNANLWYGDTKLSLPTIAIVDSGIQSRADFGSRLLASVNLSTIAGNTSLDDGRGHGTFVAGIAASSAAGNSGAAPSANLVSVKVMDSTGTGNTSDIINACQWILDHKDQYNIKVANFSLHSSIVAPFYVDPLDRAVEKLWFNGVTVVTAAGNYGVATGPSGVKYSPGNDPYVITVGAADIGRGPSLRDDTIAPWSAWGHTMDGFFKPELSADGRYMIGPVPTASSLATQRADHVTSVNGANAYMQLSGTSFSAPVVSGTAAQILARHPGFTPDQVKGALMLSARPLPGGIAAGGVGEVTASRAAAFTNPPNPNRVLDTFMTNAGTASQAFDSASWLSAVQASASWNNASWDSASWASASWDSASWLDASWDTASWLDASWNDASWVDASWLDASWEDAAEADSTSDTSALTMDTTDVTDLNTDPDLAVDPSVLPPDVITTTTTDTTTVAPTTDTTTIAPTTDTTGTILTTP